jgi:FKBP-type peptidyl-prolyl cis-trans isomerase FklB
MRKDLYRFLSIPAAGLLFCGMALAQQSSAPTTQTPSGQQPSANKPASSTAAKKPAAASTAKPLTLETQKDKVSYAIGMNVGKNLSGSLKKQEIEVDTNILVRAIKDAFTDATPLMTDDEAKTVITTLEAEVKKHQQEVYQATLAKNKQEGEAFLEANKAKPDVVTLPDGLQYKILQAGDGPKPAPTDMVVCNYRGTLVDGTEFDSSYKRGKPETLAVNRVIKGWTEALQLMPVGSKWELYIPSNLAYGERGAGPNGPIGPNAALVFQVELLSIQPKPAPPAPKLEAPGGQPVAQPQPQAQPQGQQAPAQAPPAAKP